MTAHFREHYLPLFWVPGTLEEVEYPGLIRELLGHFGVDLTGMPDAAEGDEVVLIGRQGDEEIDAAEVAAWVGTISYEVLCGLSPRVPRVYIQEGKPVERCSLLGCSPVSDRQRPRKELSR